MSTQIFADAPAAVPTVSDFIARSQSLNLNLQPSPELTELIREYEELITRSKNFPGVEWAMWDLARLYSSNNDIHADPIGDSLERSIVLYRGASALAQPGIGLWRECQFGLATQLRRKTDIVTVLPECRSIIEDLRERFPADPSVQLQCQEQMVFQWIAENHLEEAEKICRKLLAIESEQPAPAVDQPSFQSVPRERIQACQIVTINALFQAALKQSGRAGVPDAWLDAFSKDFPTNSYVKDAVSMVRELKEHLQPAAITPLGRGPKSRNRYLQVFIANSIGLAVVCAAVKYRRFILVGRTKSTNGG